MTAFKPLLTDLAAQQIRGVMRLRGVTQRELAEKMGVAQGTISAYLLQKLGTTTERCQLMYNALGEDPRVSFLIDTGVKINPLYFSGLSRFQQHEFEQHDGVKLLEGLAQVSKTGPLSLYFTKISEIYQSREDVDFRLKVVRSLDALILSLE